MLGRAGREKEEGNVIIQTYNPENFPIQCAKQQNYIKFYEEEIKLRKVLKYPPFCDIIKIEVNDLEDENANKIITLIYENLLKNGNSNMAIYSPLPSPINKIKNRYRWRIIIKCLINDNIIDIINKAVDSIKLNNTTRINVDINPNNMN